jgi:hypothetical protein
MNLKLNKTVSIPDIPSASGIAKYGTHYFVVGDDSPYLFEIDANFQIVRKIRLFSEEELIGKRIPKAKKPDFEALEIIDNKELIIFGSGSKSPQRNLFIRIHLDSMEIKKTNISLLYEKLKSLPEMEHVELNIEATSYKDGFLHLFNRSNNLLFVFNYADFIDFVENKGAWSEPKTFRFSLPKINNFESKFSGATVLTNAPFILFTSSVEDTNNAYDDGEILGSFVGIIDLATMQFDGLSFFPVPQKENPLKVESITISQENGGLNHARIILVTDSDGGISELLDCELEF